MKILLSWICDYVALHDKDPREIADRLTMGTAEIESLITTDDGDIVLEIDNKSITHRPDLWCHYGFARELAALYSLPLQPLGLYDFSRKIFSMPPVSVTVEDHHVCPQYSAVRIEGVHMMSSPEKIIKRLRLCDVKPGNIIVDLTNYVLFEIGQPLHAFDGAVVSDIRVASAGQEQPFAALNDVVYTVSPDMVLIYHQRMPVALGGIIGGKQSSISEKTACIVLESANFLDSAIRRTSQRVGLRTDASVRFEKGISPDMTEVAIQRYLYLLTMIMPQAAVATPITTISNRVRSPRRIKTSYDFIAGYAGHDITPAESKSILTRLGFIVTEYAQNSIEVEVPYYRSSSDISIPEDIVEEVLRVYGYNNIQPTQPSIHVTPCTADVSYELEGMIKDVLSHRYAFHEIHTYAWSNTRWCQALGIPQHPQALTLVNPVAENFMYLKTDVCPNVLEITADTMTRMDAADLYEISSSYIQETEGVREEKYMMAVSFVLGKEEKEQDLFLRYKTIIHEIFFKIQRGPYTLQQATPPLEMVWIHPKLNLFIMCEGKICGYLACLNPALNKHFAKKARIVLCSLNIAMLMQCPTEKHVLMPIPRYPSIPLDINVVVQEGIPYAQVYRDVCAFRDALIQRPFSFVSFYTGGSLPAGVKSFCFRCIVGSYEKTLTNEEIKTIHEKIVSHIREKGYQLR